MTELPDFGSVRRAVELINTPQVAEVLACLHQGVQPASSRTDADRTGVTAAVQRLMDLGVVHEVQMSSDEAPGQQRWVALTSKGRTVAQLVQELRDTPRASKAADAWRRAARRTEAWLHISHQ